MNKAEKWFLSPTILKGVQDVIFWIDVSVLNLLLFAIIWELLALEIRTLYLGNPRFSIEFLSSPYYSFCFYVYDSYLETILLSPKSDAWQMKWNPSVSFYASCVVNEKKNVAALNFFFFQHWNETYFAWFFHLVFDNFGKVL